MLVVPKGARSFYLVLRLFLPAGLVLYPFLCCQRLQVGRKSNQFNFGQKQSVDVDLVVAKHARSLLELAGA